MFRITSEFISLFVSPFVQFYIIKFSERYCAFLSVLRTFHILFDAISGIENSGNSHIPSNRSEVISNFKSTWYLTVERFKLKLFVSNKIWFGTRLTSKVKFKMKWNSRFAGSPAIIFSSSLWKRMPFESWTKVAEI